MYHYPVYTIQLRRFYCTYQTDVRQMFIPCMLTKQSHTQINTMTSYQVMAACSLRLRKDTESTYVCTWKVSCSTLQILLCHCSWCSLVMKYVCVCVSVSSTHTSTHLMHVCNTMFGWPRTMVSVLQPLHSSSLQVHTPHWVW